MAFLIIPMYAFDFSLCHFGHTNNGSVRGTADEVFSRIKHPRNISQFVKTIYQIKLDKTTVNHDTGNIGTNILRPYYPQNDIFFHLPNIQKTSLLMLGFGNLTAHGVEKLELRLMDSGLVTSRPLTSFGQYDAGSIVVEESKSNKFLEHHYNVVLEQNKFLEDDNNCINYPSHSELEKFNDYQSCEDAFQREYLKANVPCKPYWAFGHVDEEPSVCYSNESVHNTVNLLFVGATVSSCPLPCTTTVAKTKLRFEKVTDAEVQENEYINWIVFYLPANMRVTETLLKDTTFSQVLSDLGGTFGLWLGLGVLQLFQSVATFKVSLATKMLKKMYHQSSTRHSVPSNDIK